MIIALINATVIASHDILTELLCLGFVAGALALMGCWRQALLGLAAFAALIALLRLFGLADTMLAAAASMIAISFRKILPGAVFSSGMMAATTVGELISAMQSLGIPKVIVIPFAVAMRFFPTAREELAAIQEAAKLRGLRFSMERTLIPMMMRCDSIAEELSAAAVARGIESAKKRTSMRELKFGVPDFCVTASFLALFAFAVMGGVPLLVD
jgi:energy-coupling factor transport system permease protein